MGVAGEAVDGEVFGDFALDLDVEASFFEGLADGGLLWGFTWIDGASGEDPDGYIAPFCEEDRFAIGGEKNGDDAHRRVSMGKGLV